MAQLAALMTQPLHFYAGGIVRLVGDCSACSGESDGHDLQWEAALVRVLISHPPGVWNPSLDFGAVVPLTQHFLFALARAIGCLFGILLKVLKTNFNSSVDCPNDLKEAKQPKILTRGQSVKQMNMQLSLSVDFVSVPLFSSSVYKSIVVNQKI